VEMTAEESPASSSIAELWNKAGQKAVGQGTWIVKLKSDTSRRVENGAEWEKGEIKWGAEGGGKPGAGKENLPVAPTWC